MTPGTGCTATPLPGIASATAIDCTLGTLAAPPQLNVTTITIVARARSDNFSNLGIASFVASAFPVAASAAVVPDFYQASAHPG